jgi:hypothetical protein
MTDYILYAGIYWLVTTVVGIIVSASVLGELTLRRLLVCIFISWAAVPVAALHVVIWRRK